MLTVVRADKSLLLLKERLLVHERLLDAWLGGLEGATIIRRASYAPGAMERLGSFQKELYSASEAWRAQGVPDAFTACIAFTDTVRWTVMHEAEYAATTKVVRPQFSEVEAWRMVREGGALPPSTQAADRQERRGAVREPGDDLTGDTRSESSESETCGPSSAAEESSSSSEDDEMTEVDWKTARAGTLSTVW